jgi:creatinine amidohydrolase/Fe(II)-dependent formamide hydrolase-like protein
MNLTPLKVSARLASAFSLLAVIASLRAASPNSVFLEDFTWPELAEEIGNGTTNVLIFSGSVEETGSYVVLGKHNIRARAYSERIAREVGHTLVAPIIPCVPTSGPLMMFPGTINVTAPVYSAYLADIVRSVAKAGFKRIFLMGDHGGTVVPMKELAPKLDAEYAPKGVRVLYVGDNYEKGTVDVEAFAKQRGLNGAGHGGLWDTAELWAVSENAVRPKLFAPNAGAEAESMAKRGTTGDPAAATPELGREFANIRVSNGVKQIRALLASEPAAPTSAAPAK